MEAAANETIKDDGNEAPVILIVDDSPDNLNVLGNVLCPHYRVRVADSGVRALEMAARKPSPDLIPLDVMMPGMDGYAVLGRLKADPATRDVPVIFLTAMDSTKDEERGLEIGAVDYVTKPIRPTVVLARVRIHLELKRARDWLTDQNIYLEAEVSRRMAENQLIQDVSIHALARLAETRDPETGNHLRRTQAYVETLARKLRYHKRFASFLSERTIRLLVKSAPLHDIGKVGIPDHILLKPGKLTAEEWDIMKTHSRLGADAIDQAERDAAKSVEFLAIAKEIAHWHHERWDGSGYPDGLRWNDIPISARLMALADVFDALISRRVYKSGMSAEQARVIIVDGRGSQFDPDVVDAFEASFDEFAHIAVRYWDDEDQSTAPGAA